VSKGGIIALSNHPACKQERNNRIEQSALAHARASVLIDSAPKLLKILDFGAKPTKRIKKTVFLFT
jgi:hypothetical protein